MIHANGHTATVAVRGQATLIDRIGYLYGTPTGYAPLICGLSSCLRRKCSSSRGA